MRIYIIVCTFCDVSRFPARNGWKKLLMTSEPWATVTGNHRQFTALTFRLAAVLQGGLAAEAYAIHMSSTTTSEFTTKSLVS